MNRARRTLTPILIILLAVLLSGCGEEESSPTTVQATLAAIDDAPPAIPTGLVAASSGSMVKIRWEPNTTDLDLAGFLVYRLAFGNSYLLTDVPTSENSYLDERPLRTACVYAVTAVDSEGNESPWQTVPYDSQPDLMDRQDCSGIGE